MFIIIRWDWGEGGIRWDGGAIKWDREHKVGWGGAIMWDAGHKEGWWGVGGGGGKKMGWEVRGWEEGCLWPTIPIFYDCGARVLQLSLK